MKTSQSQTAPAEVRENIMGTMEINPLLLKLSIPMMISMLVQALYNVVDSVFVSHVSESALTAVSLAFSLQNVMIAVGVGTGVGVNALLSKSLGEKNQGRANATAENGIFLSLCSFVVFFVIGLTCMKPYFYAQTSDAVIAQQGIRYLSVCCIFSLGIFTQTMGEKLLAATGRTQLSMISQLVGAVVNIILDPIFIFVFRWGMMGAAVATVIGQVLTAVLSIWYLMHTKTIHLKSSDFRVSGKIAGKTLSLGICSFLSQISLVAAMAAINNMIRKYGALAAVFGLEEYAHIPMAVVGIVMKFFQIVISIVVGMAAGCIPIVGFNMGAGKRQRVKELFTKLLIAEACVGGVALILVEFFPRQLIRIFGAANESSYYTAFAVKAFRTYLCMMIFACINKACFIFLQAMGKAVESTALSMIREILFGVGFALLLPIWFGLDGVLYSMPVSDVLTLVVSLLIIAKAYWQLSK